MRSAALTLGVVFVLLVAGCTAPASPDSPVPTTDDGGTGADGGTDGTDGTTRTDGTDTTDDGSPATPNHPPDPATDRLGWEQGYWHNETISVTSEDGYNRSELETILARSMARVEYVRQLEFERNVSLEVISRAEYRNRSVFESRPNPYEDQVWEAAFLVDENTQSSAAFNEIYGGSVAGYYTSNQIVIVSDAPGSVELSRSTLAHELVHGLQDQHELYPSNRRRTFDGSSAATALSEGDANFVMDRYVDRCGEAWNCIPAANRSGGSPTYNRGLFLTVFTPYSEGPSLIQELYQRGGWDAVNAAYDDPPVSTEQVIHPEKYPEETPVDVQVEDRSNARWSPIREGSRSQDTLGEASLYAMFWHNGIVPEEHLQSDERRYNYSHPLSAGWAGDGFVPYEHDDEYGYVWEIHWDSTQEARDFHQAYLALLEENGAREVRDGVYRIPSTEPYADAFRVTRDGNRVVIVNAPEVRYLEGVHAEQ